MSPADVQRLAPTMFLVLFTLISVNTLVFFSYYMQNKRNKLTRQMFFYWLVQVAAFLMGPLFQEGNLAMCVPYSTNIALLYFFYQGMFAEHASIPSFKKFFYFFCLSWPAAIALEFLYGDFTITTMPLTIALTLPLICMMKFVLFDKEKRFRTLHHKWAFVGLGASIVSAFSFSFFRDDPSALIWGLTGHILIVVLFGIIISNFHNYMLHKSENERLEKLVKVRTYELNEKYSLLQELKENNDRLFKVVLHDISNPMSAVLGYLSFLDGPLLLNQEKRDDYLRKAAMSANSVANIIRQVRIFASTESKSASLYKEPISLIDAFQVVETVFLPLYEKKNVKLKMNFPKSDVVFYGNKELFIHSVLGNLLSNSLKFSTPGDAVTLSHAMEDGVLKIIVKDQGQGIKKDAIPGIFDFTQCNSSPGTHGEKGTGFGLPLLKRYMDHVKGEVNIETKERANGVDDHGTCIQLQFSLKDQGSLSQNQIFS